MWLYALVRNGEKGCSLHYPLAYIASDLTLTDLFFN